MKKGENIPHLEITEVVLLHCNINGYQQDWRVLYRFVSNESSGHLLGISPKYFIFLKTLTQNFHILKYDLPIINLTIRDGRWNKHYVSYQLKYKI